MARTRDKSAGNSKLLHDPNMQLMPMKYMDAQVYMGCRTYAYGPGNKEDSKDISHCHYS